jgi:GntR family transcriptional repressor for pyruvate dehydrogenase complex
MAKRPKATIISAEAAGVIEKKPLGQQVVNRILELVSTGNLRPGDRLPSERKLIEIFGISRPSLREALRALSVLGVVEPRHGGGAYITNLEPERLLAPLDFYLSLSQSNLDDSFESRRVIEVEIVRKAARKADAEDLAELAAMIDAQPAVVSDPIAFRILDSRFHEKLSEIAGNAVLQRVANALYNMGLDIRRRATEARSTIAQSSKDHALIVEAISARDPDRAAEAMRCHLAHIEETTRQFATLSRHELLVIDGFKPRRGNERSGRPRADGSAGASTAATSAAKK